jgi:hypothetical protein
MGTVLGALGARTVEEAADYSWGRRAVMADPDGRPVEIYTRG